MTKKLRKLAMFAVLSIAVGAATLTSCGKDDEVINDDYYYQLKVKEVESENTVIEQYGRLISKALLNTEFRGELKKAVMEKFDGDYDVLAINLKPDSLQAYSGMAEILKNTYNENFMAEYGKTYAEFLTNTFATIPNLQISVPVNCDEWNTSSYIPYVLPLYVDQEEGDGEMVQAFNGLGETFMFDMGEKPNVPVIVISISERVDKKLRLKKYLGYSLTPMQSTPPVITEVSIDRYWGGELQLHWSDVSGELGYKVFKKAGIGDFVEIATPNANQNYYIDVAAVPGIWNQYMVCSYNEYGNSSVMKYLGKHASYRDEGQRLKITSLRFNNEDAMYRYEEWPRGCPELTLYVVSGNKSTNSAEIISTSHELEPSSEEEICDEDGWNPNETVLNMWTTSDYGEILTFFWVEIDGGWFDFSLDMDGKVEASVDSLFGGIFNGTLSMQGKVSVDIGSKDDTIGRCYVHFWDRINEEYSIGGFNWTLGI